MNLYLPIMCLPTYNMEFLTSILMPAHSKQQVQGIFLFLEHSSPKPLDLPTLGRIPARSLKQPVPCLSILESDGLFGSLDPHPTFFIHGDGLAGFKVGALGYEGSC
jgi:hypothetical protein